MFLTILLSILMSFAPLQVDAHQSCAAQSENVELKLRHRDYFVDSPNMYLTFYEMSEYWFYDMFMTELSQSESAFVFNTSVTKQNFYDGTMVLVSSSTMSQSTMKLGHFDGSIGLWVDDVNVTGLHFSYTNNLYNQGLKRLNVQVYTSSNSYVDITCTLAKEQGLEYRNLSFGNVTYNNMGGLSGGNYGLRYNIYDFKGLMPDKIYFDTDEVSYQNGYSRGVAETQIQSYDHGYYDGQLIGYQSGYADGLAEAQSQDTLALQIFSGCVEVGLLPINVMLRMFEYEVFGINIAGFVSALLTIAIVIIVIRVVTGKKDD